MRRLNTFVSILGLAALGGFFNPALADVTNSYHLNTTSIWDISGNYSNDTLSVGYTLSQDGKGKITGIGSAVYSNVDLYAEMDFDIKGHIMTHNDITTLHFVMETSGNVDYEGQTYPFRLTGGYQADVDPEKKALVGSIKATVQIGGETVSLDKTFTEDMPVGMDGSADLEVVFREAKKGIVGNAVLTLSNGAKLNYSVKGALDARKGGRFQLKGLGDAQGSSINLDTDASYNLIGAKGRVMGQKIEM